jgi:TctA family transporter
MKFLSEQKFASFMQTKFHYRVYKIIPCHREVVETIPHTPYFSVRSVSVLSKYFIRFHPVYIHNSNVTNIRLIRQKKYIFHTFIHVCIILFIAIKFGFSMRFWGTARNNDVGVEHRRGISHEIII